MDLPLGLSSPQIFSFHYSYRDVSATVLQWLKVLVFFRAVQGTHWLLNALICGFQLSRLLEPHQCSENTVEDAALPFPAFRSERASHHYCCCQYSPVVSIYRLLFHTQNIQHMKSSMSDILNPPNVQLHENLDITDFTKQT